MVYYIEEGNIFQIPQIRNYAHGCNCVGAMGKGIALQFKGRFPEMYEQYKRCVRPINIMWEMSSNTNTMMVLYTT